MYQIVYKICKLWQNGVYMLILCHVMFLWGYLLILFIEKKTDILYTNKQICFKILNDCKSYAIIFLKESFK